MNARTGWHLAADVVLVVHVLFVLFVVAGLLLVFAGRLLKWSWVRNPWFRIAHLGAIVIVVAHRPGAIAGCDQLLLLANGRQVAFGPRDTILRESGLQHSRVPAS